MKAALRHMTTATQRGLVLMSIALAVVGGTVGLLLSQALAENITCSHVHQWCRGTQGNDNIQGWENWNEINGELGLDSAWGYGGGDEVFGGGNGDTLFGGAGADSVRGQDGNDSYFSVGGSAGAYGNPEADIVEGNAGFDVVEGDTGQDSMYGEDNEDYLFAEDGQPDTVNGGEQYDRCYVDASDSWFKCEAVF